MGILSVSLNRNHLKKKRSFFCGEGRIFVPNFFFKCLILCHLPVTVDDDTCSVTTRHIVPVYNQSFFLLYVPCITIVLSVVEVYMICGMCATFTSSSWCFYIKSREHYPLNTYPKISTSPSIVLSHLVQACIYYAGT